MPQGVTEGMQTLRELLSLAPQTKVIVVTGNADRDNAVRAVSFGAYDFYQKPVDTDVLRLLVGRAFHISRAGRAEPAVARGAAHLAHGRVHRHRRRDVQGVPHDREGGAHRCIGADPRRKRHRQGAGRARRCTRRAAASAARFVADQLRGDSRAAARERVVRLREGRVHRRGRRPRWARSRPPAAARCSSTRSATCRCALQAKLLRFLQDRIIERVGGRQEIPVDVRVVCATNRDLQAFIVEQKFRQDLYFRIGEITINVPPLRERVGGATVLAHAMLRKFSNVARPAQARIHRGRHRGARGVFVARQCPRAREPREDRDDHVRNADAHGG